MGTKTKNVIYVRWLIRKDMPAINEINIEASYQLLEEDMTKMLKQRNVVGMVVELDEVVAGYMIYALEKGSIDLYHLVIDPVFHGQGLGTALIETLKTRLGTPQGRTAIYTTVSEYDVQAQVFFRAVKFFCVETIRGWDENGDGYLFEYAQYD
jgi:ribosomal protein S18 acetylase RimI-like enzyme